MTNTIKTTIECIRLTTGPGTSAACLVKRGERIIGRLEKYCNSQYEVHPWKAFSGVGHSLRYLRAFYEEDGGKASAIKAIERADEGCSSPRIKPSGDNQ